MMLLRRLATSGIRADFCATLPVVRFCRMRCVSLEQANTELEFALNSMMDEGPLDSVEGDDASRCSWARDPGTLPVPELWIIPAAAAAEEGRDPGRRT